MKSLIGEKTKKHFSMKLFGDTGTELKLVAFGTPRATHFKNVRSEFSKSNWDKIRRQIYRDANYRCEICDEQGMAQGYGHPVECHEVWDLDFETKEQSLVEFIALCPRCHKIVHLTLTGHLVKKGEITMEEYWNILDHYANVNEIERCHVEESFHANDNFHRRKHRINWKINIDFAHEYLSRL